MEEVKYSRLRLQTAACHFCSIIMSFWLIPTLYFLLNPHSKEAKRRAENSTQSSRTAARRRKEAATKTKIHTNTSERTAFSSETQSSGKAWRILWRAHNWRTLTNEKHTRVRLHTHTHARTHAHGFTKTYQHCLKLRLDHQPVFRHCLKSSIVRNGMHSRSSFGASSGTGNLFHDCSFVVHLSEFYSAWGHCFLNVWSF